MNKIIALLLMTWLNNTIPLSAQELYKPRNILQAIQNGTRSESGKPGVNYWQNKGKYDLDIQLNPVTKIIAGHEDIIYTNNSPDTLKNLVFNFVNNIHKPGVMRTSIPEEDFITSGLVVTNLSINGEEYNMHAEDRGTLTSVTLKKPILPKSQTKVTVDWNYPLSVRSDREGQIDSTTFFVAYSYPRISVYDDYNGWDMIPHNGQVEFYNDFNDYQLNITVPRNYVVWATGDLVNPEEVLQPAVAARLRESMKDDQVVKVASTEEMAAEMVTQQNRQNRWTFVAEHITDVAFAVSNHYQWDASSVVADPGTKRRVSTQAAYGPDAKDYLFSVKWSNKALSWYSNIWPAISYPYSKMTVFQGFAGMEYPMMVNDASTEDILNALRVQNHEIAHTYFPFYMGINETRYAFMDEGWATISEYMIGLNQLGKEKADSIFRKYRVRNYIEDPSAEQDQPLIAMASQVAGAAYRTNAYSKSSLALLALQDLLGEDGFKKAFRQYVALWNGKHPNPWDYFNCLNTVTGENLNWFWNNWYFSNYYPDLAIAGVSNQSVTIRNTGGFAIPFDLMIHYADGRISKVHQSPVVWKPGEKEIHISLENSKDIMAVEINNGIFMDATPMDNRKEVVR